MTDVTGQAAPGPYKENGRITVSAGQPVKLQAIGVTFKGNTLVVKPGDKISLSIDNCATFKHNFFSPALKVDPAVDIAGAKANVDVTFTAPTAPGKYMFWCSTTPPGMPSHGERGMTGEVIVQ